MAYLRTAKPMEFQARSGFQHVWLRRPSLCLILVLFIVAPAQGEEILDQISLGRIGIGFAVFPEQSIGQTFTVGIGGTLSKVGVQISNRRSPFTATGDIRLAILNLVDGIPETAVEIASVMIPVESVPIHESGFVLWFIDADLSDLKIEVSVGQVLAIALEYQGPHAYTWWKAGGYLGGRSISKSSYYEGKWVDIRPPGDLGFWTFVAELVVDIDIKPSSDTNPISPSGRGVITVAVLGSETFDVTEIELTTLSFGPNEAAPAHAVGGHLDDVDQDGFTDLVSHYWIRDTGIIVGDEEACVTGETISRTAFEGCDAIQTIPR